MPSILNLKFKGNKSFVPFSNLSDADSLTKTWKVCTKVASFLEQGQRLENLSWRLWHLQNLMVDTDNAKSKRDFKKLSKCMSDKLDKEKGRSIEELQAPDFKRNHSTELLQQRALEKEREREASQNGRPGTIHRMQFTFSVDQPASVVATAVSTKKPDMRPSSEFKDIAKRGRPATRSTTAAEESAAARDCSTLDDKDQPLTHRGRKLAAAKADPNKDELYQAAALRFPSLFSNDFGPSALLYPTPTVTNAMTYGEGVGSTNNNSDGFSIVRPTIELPLDELLNADSPGGWSSGFHHQETRQPDHIDSQEDVEMKVATNDTPFPHHAPRAEPAHEEENLLKSAALRNVSALSAMEDVVPRTITPSRIGPNSGPGANTTTTTTTGKRPSLSVRTQSVSTRSTGPSATPVNTSQQNNSSNSAPGGVKAECSNCGATHTPLWRRGLNDELNCNACGLYCKLHKRPRPKSMRNNHGEGRAQAAPRQESQEVVAQCYNCHTTATPLWRKDDEGKTVCNACGLYYKLHGSARPISMKSDVIRKRARHDARRGAGNGSSETPPSASPGASRRPSPNAESTPTLAPDSSTQVTYGGGEVSSTNSAGNNLDYRGSLQSELLGALGSAELHYGHQLYSQSSYFPGPYHPDYISHTYSIPSDALPFSSGDTSDADSASECRSSKRRRMSNDSASEPPSSAVSFSSYADSFTSTSSSASHSQRSSVDFPYTPYSSGSFNMLRGGPWHPPMMPPGDGSPSLSFVHPPMLPSAGADDSPMFFHPPMIQHQDDTDALFAAYLHPPMLPPDDSPPMSSLQLHPPMISGEWKMSGHAEYDSNAMVTF
ncbi:transcription factor [Ganoderma sinense ZZ0214-1]|uniref:Transcription factor n=1 Tax=Ganoderma sinense ZZ0214-1 TaxID=1077348 RepID=A0A2G8RW61_9APHY|nr:transcription factor [Ganoderma sinense ZZ0214-1]